MAITANYTRGFSILGQSYSATTTVSSAYADTWSVTLAAAKIGQLTTRVSGTAGTLTMAGGHGITDGQRLDIYWTGGVAYGATVGTVSTNSVPFTLAQGDALPTNNTAITAQVPTLYSGITTAGSAVVSIAVKMPQGGETVFATSGAVAILAVGLSTTTTTYVWSSSDSGTNPVTGSTIARVYLSQGNSGATTTVSGTVQYN